MPLGGSLFAAIRKFLSHRSREGTLRRWHPRTCVCVYVTDIRSDPMKRLCLASKVLPLATVFLVPCLLLAGEGRERASEPEETIDLFAAIDRGDVDVRLIPRDARHGNVLIENKTEKPLTVELPDAFAAVRAQFGDDSME
jgi:hypothetical protein